MPAMQAGARRRRIVIVGAAGRDFHNFNVVFRDDPSCEVVAFTATQIPDIAGRRYPASLAGPLYPAGIPIAAEADLEALIRSESIDQAVFAYSDVSHLEVMHTASRVLAEGADFELLGPRRTMLGAARPVIAVSAVRTGCGKSQTARWLSGLLRRIGLRVAVIRHPMPYGDLERQAAQRFASRADLDAAACTIEEREEYEPHLAIGNTVFAGIDCARVTERAAAVADVIVWDGGNNDFPFLRPDLHLVLVDPLRPGHETTHHPGETVLRMADIVIVAKSDTARAEDVERVETTVRSVNPRAIVVRGASPIVLDDPGAVRDRTVLVIEDGPSLTHGGLSYGAGYVAATRAGAASIVDPRGFAAPAIAQVFREYPHIGAVLPALGYSAAQRDAMRATIDASDAEVIVAATPADLSSLIGPDRSVVRARYEFAETGGRLLQDEIERFLRTTGLIP
jgi:predicted GTPase